MYLQNEGFQILEQRGHSLNQVGMFLNESVARSPLYLWIPQWIWSTEKNDSLTHNVFLQVVLHSTNLWILVFCLASLRRF